MGTAVSFSEVPSNEFSYRGLTKLTVSIGRKRDESKQLTSIKDDNDSLNAWVAWDTGDRRRRIVVNDHLEASLYDHNDD